MMCRILVVKGFVMVLWQLLTPAVFDYKASCDSSGHTIYEHITEGKQPKELLLLSSTSSSSSSSSSTYMKKEMTTSSPSSCEKNGTAAAATGIQISIA
jgi:hypothetical protein